MPSLTAVSWVPNADGDWSTAADWSTGIVPDSNSSVTINTTALHTITHSQSNDTIGSLTVGNDNLDITGGSLTVLGAASFANGFSLSGGTVTFDGTSTFSGTFSQTGGELIANAVVLSGSDTMLNGSDEGSTAVSNSGTLALGNFLLGGAVTLTNTNTVNLTEQITLGDATGVNATINNKAAATWNFAADVGITLGAASASFTNAGLIEKTAGTGTSTLGANLTSTGTISAQTGVIDLQGPNNTVTGTVSGAGTLAFGGTSSLVVTSFTPGTLSVGGLYLGSDSTVNVGAGATYTGALTIAAGNFTSTLNLGSFTWTQTGTASFSAGFGLAVITGSGTLVTDGVTSITTATIGGTETVQNNGTFYIVGATTLGDGSGEAAAIDNSATGTIDFTGDSYNLAHGADAGVLLTNAGLLEKGAGSALNAVQVDVNSTGTVTAVSGQLDFQGATNTIGGSITGAGQVSFDSGGTTTLSNGVSISVAELGLYGGADLILGGTLAYANIFNDAAVNSTTTVNLAGHSLSLSGTSYFDAGFGLALVTGGGKLLLSGTTTLANMELGGTTALTNSATVLQTGQVTLGDGSGLAASITNASTGTWNITTDVGIGIGANVAETFTNAGTLTKTGGTATSTIAANLQDTGSIVVNSATLGVSNTANSIAGSVAGAGTFDFFNSSITKLAKGATFTVATTVLNDAQVTLAANVGDSGVFDIAAANGTGVLTLGGFTFAANGGANFSAGFGQAYVNGAGTLKLNGSSSGANVTFGGTVAVQNYRAFNQTGQVTIGDSSGLAASITNEAGATWTITNATGIGAGSGTIQTFTNDATFTDVGSGTSTVADAFVNITSAKVLANAGTLSFTGSVTNNGTMTATGATLSISGPLSGTGALDAGAGGILALSVAVPDDAEHQRPGCLGGARFLRAHANGRHHCRSGCRQLDRPRKSGKCDASQLCGRPAHGEGQFE